MTVEETTEKARMNRWKWHLTNPDLTGANSTNFTNAEKPLKCTHSNNKSPTFRTPNVHSDEYLLL